MLGVPATLQASLMARLDRLGLAAKRVAQIGAAIGREFSYELAAAVGGFTEAGFQEALQRLSDVSGIQLGFPHDFLAGLHARAAIGGVIKAVPSTRGREIVDVN